MLRAPSFEVIRWLKIADNSLDYSLGNTTKQALWLPTSREAKYKAKQAVDAFCVRAGDVLTAGVVYTGELASFTIPTFAALNIVFVLGWLATVRGLTTNCRPGPEGRPCRDVRPHLPEIKPMKPRRTLSTKIGIGLAAGVALGLLVGERASVLKVVADGYIKLLQMTVLPFVTVSIIGGVGALNGAQARALAKQVGIVLALLWALALTLVFLFPLMFPPHESASFFSTTLIQEREPFDFLNLYIPTNPFNSLANNIVPAVVLFSLIVGAALMTIPDKARLLDVLAVISSAVSKATHFVVALTPYGIFAIAAVVAGTLSLDELDVSRSI